MSQSQIPGTVGTKERGYEMRIALYLPTKPDKTILLGKGVAYFEAEGQRGRKGIKVRPRNGR